MADRPVAIVTAAGGGIGAACARELARRGYALALMSRSGSVDAVAREIEGVSLRGSVTRPDDLARLVALALERHGRVDAVVVNTGHAPWSSDPSGRRFEPGAGHLLDIPDEDWHASLDLYFLHAVRMARLVTPVMLRQGGGAFVSLSAFAAVEPSFAFPTSSTLRLALGGFTRLYADRYARDGIRVNEVLPGYLDNWEWSDALIDSIPAGRPGRLEEVARVVAFLVSAEASYVTGQRILVDGGLIRAV